MNHGTFHVDASCATPEFHCDHTNGRFSIVLTDPLSAVPVYLTGTPEELQALGDRVWRIAANHRPGVVRVTPDGEEAWHRAFPDA